MRLLLCCEFYFPSVGGVQVVMRQIAERLAAAGHEVVVATTKLADRDFDTLNGVRIEEFAVTGNLANGIRGEVERYRQFVTNFQGDGLLIKAAQQWTFDALWPVLDDIHMRKVFIPCGFSGLYWKHFEKYFKEIPDVLRKWDHLIFYAEHYRDVDFARAHGITDFSIVPNGASETEFEGEDTDSELRARLGIPDDAFVFLTVGSRTGVKGHREIVEAFARLETDGRPVTLVLNGNTPPVPAVAPIEEPETEADAEPPVMLAPPPPPRKTFKMRRRAVKAAIKRWFSILTGRGDPLNRPPPPPPPPPIDPIVHWTEKAVAQPGKQVLLIDLERPELVSMFRQADLFVFASNIEYSPLVLYETAAAGTPFLTVPVGNSAEIAAWTGAGVLCPAPMDSDGFTRVDPAVLARAMATLMAEPDELARLGALGRERWRRHFTWKGIAERYADIIRGADVPLMDFAEGTTPARML